VNLVTVLLLSQLVAQDPAPATSPPAEAERPAARSLQLRVMVVAALQNNLTLRSARASTSSVETGIQAALGAFDPFLQLSPTFTQGDRRPLVEPGLILSGTERSTQFSGGIDGTLPWSTSYSVSLDGNRRRQDNPLLLAPGELTPTANTTLTLTVAQPLLRGFGPGIAQGPVRQARLSASSSRSRLDRLTEQVIADVESAYWNLGLASAFERISQESHERAQELMSRNQRLLELNLISEVDAITSRRGVQQRLTTLTEATRQRKDAAERLIFLVFGDSAVRYLDADLDYATEPPPDRAPAIADVAELERAALGARSDLRAARHDVDLGEVTRRLANNATLPDARLSVSYAAQTLGAEDYRLFSVSRPGDLEANDWRLGVSVSYPLWNRAARAARARAIHDLESSQAALASAEQFVRTDVRSAARAMATNVERLEQARLSLDYARQQYEAGERQLQLGLVDSFRLLQMEEEVASAALVYEQTRYDLAQAITSFELAMGTNRQKYGASTAQSSR
jgi:outer membrane protein TolC